MAVAEVHVLGADVLGPLVPVVVRVVGLAGDEALQKLGEVLEKAGLELVDTHAAGRVRRVHACDPVRDPALADRVGDLLRDVADAQPAVRVELPLALEHLHCSSSSVGVVRTEAYSEGSGGLRHGRTVGSYP